jgi:hypothetical protein
VAGDARLQGGEGESVNVFFTHAHLHIVITFQVAI